MSQSGLEVWAATFIDRELDVEAVDRWVERMFTRIVADVPDLAQDAPLRAAVRSACRAHWRAFLPTITSPDHHFHLVEEARGVAMTAAQHGLKLPILFRIYAAGEQEVWGFLTEEVGREELHGADPAEILIHIWSRVSAWFDRSLEESVVIFEEEVQRIRHSDTARRLDVVKELLAGVAIDDRELSARLGGHPVSAFQTALVLHTGDNRRISDLPAVTGRLAAALGAQSTLVVHPGGRDLWAWVATAAEPDVDAVRRLTDWLGEQRVAVALGSPQQGANGVRESHVEALAAQHVALQDPAAALTLFEDVELLSLVGDGERMRRFVRRTLGDLAGDDEGAHELRRTLTVLLRSGSVDAAARELHVHKNTVRYRVGRAEALMGRPLAEDRSTVDIALRCRAAFLTTRW